jgi:hypothetical protein
MSKRKKSRRKRSEKKLRFYRIAKEFCASNSLPAPSIQFKKGSCGYIVKTQTIEVDEDETYDNFHHALGHHKYFMIHSLKDRLLKRISRVCLISGVSMIYFDWANPLTFLLFLLPYSHHIIRQFYAEKHVPKESQSITRWLRLLIPISQ